MRLRQLRPGTAEERKALAKLRSAVRRQAKKVAAEIGDEERVARICAGVLRDLDEPRMERAGGRS